MKDPTATIGENCLIGPNVTIGPNCVIGDGFLSSLLSSFSSRFGLQKIDQERGTKGVRIHNTALLSGSKLKNNCLVKNSIIGWNSSVGSWVCCSLTLFLFSFLFFSFLLVSDDGTKGESGRCFGAGRRCPHLRRVAREWRHHSPPQERDGKCS